MSDYVIKYMRGEEVKYISHLDFVRFIHRLIRRCDLPMAFSQGFNPHPIMTVALPLSVGVTADGELMKISFEGDFEPEFIKDTINNAFPKGFKITKIKKTEGKEIDFSKINAASYIVKCETSQNIDIQKFLQNPEIKVMKKSKSGVKEADIKPHIHSLEIIQRETDTITFAITLDAGNIYNLKPDTVIDAMQKYTDGFETAFFSVRRTALLADGKELF